MSKTESKRECESESETSHETPFSEEEEILLKTLQEKDCNYTRSQFRRYLSKQKNIDSLIDTAEKETMVGKG